MKNSPEGLNSRIKLENKELANLKRGKLRLSNPKNRKKNECRNLNRVSKTVETIMSNTIPVWVGFPGDERKKGTERVSVEIMDKNLPNLMKNIYPQT